MVYIPTVIKDFIKSKTKIFFNTHTFWSHCARQFHTSDFELRSIVSYVGIWFICLNMILSDDIRFHDAQYC